MTGNTSDSQSAGQGKTSEATSRSGPRAGLGALIILVVLISGLGGPLAYVSFPDGPDIDCGELRLTDEGNSRDILEADLRNQLAAEEARLDNSLAQLSIEQPDTQRRIQSLTEESENLSTEQSTSKLLAEKKAAAEKRAADTAKAEHDADTQVKLAALEVNAADVEVAAIPTEDRSTDAAREARSRATAAAKAKTQADAELTTAFSDAKKAQDDLASATKALTDADAEVEIKSAIAVESAVAVADAAADAGKSLQTQIDTLEDTLKKRRADIGAQFDQVEAKRLRLISLLEDKVDSVQDRIDSLNRKAQKAKLATTDPLAQELSAEVKALIAEKGELSFSMLGLRIEQRQRIDDRVEELTDDGLEELDEMIEELQNESGQANSNGELDQEDSRIKPVGAGQQGLQDQREALVAKRKDLVDRRVKAAMAASPAVPRSSIALQPAAPVVVLSFGPDRKPQRIEVPFESTSSARGDQGLAIEPATDISADLPEKATFLAIPEALSRSDGAEISPDEITVWARRLGSTMLMSICISPSEGLPAGTYTGDVHLVDSSLNSIRVPVQVTTQFQWINVLYLLLPILPGLAVFYVWYTGRFAADENPWNMTAWWSWLKVNGVLLLAVGFASVWATLQVAFNNPTWGSTVFGSAAVVGAGLVASITAMAAVAGSVRGPGIKETGSPKKSKPERSWHDWRSVKEVDR